MPSSLGLESLSNNLQDATRNSGAALPLAIKNTLVGWIQNYVFEFLWTALIFVVFAFVFYGGFLYFTAYGDENRAQMAKKTITYAFVGLAIGAAAMGIAMYVNNVLVRKDPTTPVTGTVTAPATSGSGSSGSSSTSGSGTGSSI